MDLMILVKADVSGASAKIAGLRDELGALDAEGAEGAGAGIGGVITKGAMVGTVALAGMGLAIGYGIKKWTDLGDAIKQVQATTGMAVGPASRLVEELYAYTGSLSAGQTAIRMFSKNMGAAEAGGAAQLKVFNDLGVSLKNVNGSYRDVGTVMMETRDKLSQMTNGALRADYAQTLFGRGMGSLATWLTASQPTLDAFAKKLQSLGMIWTPARMAEFESLKKALRSLLAEMMGVALELGNVFVPVVIKVLDVVNPLISFFARMPAPIRDGIIAVAALAATLAVLAGAYVKLMPALKLLEAMVGWERINNALGLAQIGWTNAVAAATWLWDAAQGGLAIATGAVAAALDSCGLGELLLIITGIILVVVALVLAFTHWHTTMRLVRDVWHLLFEGMSTDFAILKAAVTDFAKFFEGHWKLMLGLILAPWLVVIKSAITHWSDITGALTAWFTWMGQKLDWLWTKLSWPWTELKTLVTDVVGFVQSKMSLLNPLHDLGSIGSAIGGAASSAYNAIPSFAGGGTGSGPQSGWLAMLHGTETVTPGAVGGGTTVNVNIGTLQGTDESAAREFAQRVGVYTARAIRLQRPGKNG